jgi:hypothetical protein
VTAGVAEARWQRASFVPAPPNSSIQRTALGAAAAAELGQLERRWRESGSIDDEAALSVGTTTVRRPRRGLGAARRPRRLPGGAKRTGRQRPSPSASDSPLAAVDASRVKWEPRCSGRAREVIAIRLRVAQVV